MSAVGGETHLQKKNSFPLWKRCMTRLAGFLGTLLVWGISGWFVFSWAQNGEGDVESSVSYLFFSISSFLLVVNLLPFYPLDVGAILVDISNTLFGRLGERICGIFLAVVSFVLGCHFFFISFKAIGCVALASAFRSCLLLFRQDESGASKGVKEISEEVEEQWREGNQEEVIAQLSDLSQKSYDKHIRRYACFMCGKYLIALSRYREAYHLYSSARDRLPRESLELFVISAYQTSHFSKGLSLVSDLFVGGPSAAIAVMGALLSARVHKAEEAMLWLKTAASLGFLEVDKVLWLSDFDQIPR